MNDRDTSERKPRLQEVVQRGIDKRARQIFNWLPGKVTKYDASKGQVDVQPLIQEPYLDESDARQVESLPVIPAIPVLYYGSAAMCITVPISDGTLELNSQTVPATIGVILFCGRSLDKWLSGQGQEVDPQIDHEHADHDAVFVPGLNPFGSPLSVCPTDAMTVGSQTDKNARLVLKPGSGIQLGDGATAEVARKGDKAGGGTITLSFQKATGTGVVDGGSLTFQYDAGDGSGMQGGSITAASTMINIKEKITSGSSKVTAVD